MTKRTTAMTETSVGTELLPCPNPWCDNDNQFCFRHPHTQKYQAACAGCGIESPQVDTEADAITAWNTRAVSAAEGDLLWRCLEALDKIHGWLVCHSIASADDMAQMFPEMTAVAEDILSQAREVRSS